LLINFLNELLNIADEHKNTIFPGYTHMQKAQPITFGHYIMAYYFKFKRDLDKWKDNLQRTNIMPLGSCALAGTSFDINRSWVAKELNFDNISQNSLDGVSDRDFIIEFLSIASNFIVHLSGLSEEVILWSNKEYNYIELDDAYTTGSSIMPQKKNPDVAELARGKTGEIFGYLMQCLTVLKGLPLSYNKDLQVINESVFKSVDIITVLLIIYPEMLSTMKINKANMNKSAKKDYLNATELANYLVQKGLPFREAHNVSGEIVLYGIENNIELNELTYMEWKKFIPDFKDDNIIHDILNIKNVVKRSNSKGGPAPKELTRVIDVELEWIESIR
jgi:argininosuccinate lyase